MWRAPLTLGLDARGQKGVVWCGNKLSQEESAKHVPVTWPLLVDQIKPPYVHKNRRWFEEKTSSFSQSNVKEPKVAGKLCCSFEILTLPWLVALTQRCPGSVLCLTVRLYNMCADPPDLQISKCDYAPVYERANTVLPLSLWIQWWNASLKLCSWCIIFFFFFFCNTWCIHFWWVYCPTYFYPEFLKEELKAKLMNESHQVWKIDRNFRCCCCQLFSVPSCPICLRIVSHLSLRRQSVSFVASALIQTAHWKSLLRVFCGVNVECISEQWKQILWPFIILCKGWKIQKNLILGWIFVSWIVPSPEHIQWIGNCLLQMNKQGKCSTIKIAVRSVWPVWLNMQNTAGQFSLISSADWILETCFHSKNGR